MTRKQKTRLMVAAAILLLFLGKTLLARCGNPDGARSARSSAHGGNCMTPQERSSFDREAMFGAWQDLDGDCRNTRAEVLQASSATEVEGGCSISEGAWYDPYTGDTIRRPKDLDIDHIVPLKEAWLSGAWKWTREERVAFANSPEILLAVGKNANRSKSDKDPAEWLPPDHSFHREYARRWAAIKVKHHLSADPRERAALERLGVSVLPQEAPEGCTNDGN